MKIIFNKGKILNQDWLDLIKKTGNRLTGPRKAIVDVIAASEQVLSPQEIYSAGKQHFPGLGLVTVYRTLDKLEALGLIQRIHQPDGCHRILPAAKGHQHVLLCTGCGKAVYFSGDDLSGLFKTISIKSGFQINEHILQLLGLCENCRSTEAELG